MSWAITEKGCSQRRACLLVGIAPKTYRYRSGRASDDDVRARLRVLASERRRFGYRRRTAFERKHKGAGRPQNLYYLIQIVAPYANLPCLTI